MERTKLNICKTDAVFFMIVDCINETISRVNENNFSCTKASLIQDGKWRRCLANRVPRIEVFLDCHDCHVKGRKFSLKHTRKNESLLCFCNYTRLSALYNVNVPINFTHLYRWGRFVKFYKSLLRIYNMTSRITIKSIHITSHLS